jgi:hypothetical protein
MLASRLRGCAMIVLIFQCYVSGWEIKALLSRPLEPHEIDLSAGGNSCHPRQRLFARGILSATGNTVSQVGMVVGYRPVIVIEALLRVKTRPIEEAVADAETAYLLQDLSLSTQRRETIVKRSCQFSADDYVWGDIVLQLANAISRTTWLTEHMTLGFLNQFPNCSYLVAESYKTICLTFGKQREESIAPRIFTTLRRRTRPITPSQSWAFRILQSLFDLPGPERLSVLLIARRYPVVDVRART